CPIAADRESRVAGSNDSDLTVPRLVTRRTRNGDGGGGAEDRATAGEQRPLQRGAIGLGGAGAAVSERVGTDRVPSSARGARRRLRRSQFGFHHGLAREARHRRAARRVDSAAPEERASRRAATRHWTPTR